jgi:hypothetical protein
MGTISGSFAVGTSNKYISGLLEWSSTTNTAGNYSTVSITLKFRRTNTYTGTPTYGDGSWQVWIAGHKTDSGNKSFTIPNNNTWITVHTGSAQVSHSADGSRQINIEVDGSTTVHDVYYAISSPWLENIPRASIVSSGVSWTAGVNNLGITINRASTDFKHRLELFVQHTYDGAYDKVGERHDVRDSTTWEFNEAEIKQLYTTMSGYENRPVILRCHTYTLSGTQIGSYRDVGGIVYAVGTGTMGFNNNGQFSIGSNITGWINNYHSNFTYDVTLTFGDYQKTWPNVGQYPTLSFDGPAIQALYSKIPTTNSSGGTITTRTFYKGISTEDGAPASHNTGVVLYVDTSQNSPTFGADFTYADTNSTTTTLTGNNSYIVQNKSSLQVKIPASAKANSVNGASMSRYDITVNGVTKSVNWSTSDVNVDFGAVNASSNVQLIVKAIDSRGNFTIRTKTINIVPYSNPIVYLRANRLNGFEREATITVSGSISPVIINGTPKNSLVTLPYIEREAGGAWSGQKLFTQKSGITFPNYESNPVTKDCDILKGYEIYTNIQDKLGNGEATALIPVGEPIFFMDSVKKSVGVNKFPTKNRAFQVSGNLETDSNLIAGGFDFVLGNTDQSSRGNTGGSRALVKMDGAKLVINFLNDFTGGTEVQSDLYVNGRLKVGGQNGVAVLEGQAIPNNNLDNCFVSGVYHFNDTTIGRPASWGVVEVLVNNGRAWNGSSNWIWQVAHTTDGLPRTFVRNRVNAGAWSAWVNHTESVGDIYATLSVKAHGAISLVNNWVKYGAEYDDPTYTKTADGIVHLKGMVKSGNVGYSMATLPVGCRPNARRIFPVPCHGSTSSIPMLGRFDVEASGIISLQTGNNGWVSLDGINFYAER